MAGTDTPLVCPYCDGGENGTHELLYAHGSNHILTPDGEALGYGDEYTCLYCNQKVVYLAHENEYIKRDPNGEYVDNEGNCWTVIHEEMVIDVRTEEEKAQANRDPTDDWPSMFDE